MTWFHRKKSKILLECVTFREEVAETMPIARAGHFLPEWWKELPIATASDNNLYAAPTMKTCVGMVQAYQYGVMLPLWSDLSLTIGEKGSAAHYYQFADATSIAEKHIEDQRGSFMPDQDFLHLKIVAPWQFYCDEDVDFLFTEPTWNMPSDAQYKILPGLLNFKYQHSVNVNAMLPRTNVAQRMLIRAGQPLAHIIPLDNRRIELKIVVDEERYKTIFFKQKRRFAFIDGYKQRRAILKANENQCPYTKGML